MLLNRPYRAVRVLAAAIVTIAVSGLMTTASPVNASSETEPARTAAVADASEQDAALPDLAPPCVVVTNRDGVYEDVRNTCVNRTYRVKVIIAWGFDSPCHTLDYLDGFTHHHGSGHFDRLELC